MASKRIAILTIGVTLVASLIGDVAEAQQRGRGKGRRSGRQTGRVASGSARNAGSVTGGDLSQLEVKGLTAMMDEEKLAHDVYVTLNRASSRPIFSTIAAAESRHMNALRQLTLRYRLNIPIASNTVGQFTNPQNRDLYLKLVAAGSRSPLDALQVGAKIEEMDIADLTTTMSNSTNQDVLSVLGHLQRGSRNHLRAFSRQIRDLGGTYVAQHLSQSEFNRIAGSAVERGGQGGMQSGQRTGAQGQQQGRRGNGAGGKGQGRKGAGGGQGGKRQGGKGAGGGQGGKGKGGPGAGNRRG
jgi:hypothetical protein